MSSRYRGHRSSSPKRRADHFPSSSSGPLGDYFSSSPPRHGSDVPDAPSSGRKKDSGGSAASSNRNRHLAPPQSHRREPESDMTGNITSPQQPQQQQTKHGSDSTKVSSPGGRPNISGGPDTAEANDCPRNCTSSPPPGMTSHSYVTFQGVRVSPTHLPSRPAAGELEKIQTCADDSSSLYSQDQALSPDHVSPLHIPTRKTLQDQRDTAILLQSYGYLQEDPFPTMAEPPPISPIRSHRPLHRAKSSTQVLHEAKSHPNLQGNLEVGFEREPLYSPLAPYFADKDFPAAKRSGKVMIGNNGWLERTTVSPSRKDKAASPKKHGILDSIKKKAKEMTAEIKPQRRSREADKERQGTSSNGFCSSLATPSRTAISLDPREQSLLYCELEYHVSSALNHFISTQLAQGRLDPDKLKKVADGWASKGRPRVVGFRYDVETQLELVGLHSEEFRFYGRRQGSPVEVAGLLSAMRTNARAMRIRTFCQPDSVIAKQVCDAQALFEMLGCPESRQLALAEVAQFFKVIVERELGYRRRREQRGTVKKLPHGQGDHHWESAPGPTSAPGDDGYGGLLLIPEGYDVDSEVLAYAN